MTDGGVTDGGVTDPSARRRSPARRRRRAPADGASGSRAGRPETAPADGPDPTPVGRDGAGTAAVVPSPNPPGSRTPRATTAPDGDGGAADRASGRPRRGRGDSAAERALRSLVSTRPTQLPPSLAMRAREVETPTAEDLAAAARELVIIRRNYVPPTPLGNGRRASRGSGSGRRGRAPHPGQQRQDGARRPGDGTRQDGNVGADGSDS